MSASSQGERPKRLQFDRLDIDDGLDGDVCITIEARYRGDPEQCFYLKRPQALELAAWIHNFYGIESQQDTGK